jgi:uncharacterized protein (TIGR03067 family)
VKTPLPVAVLFALAAGLLAAAEPKTDRQKLQGTWKFVSGESKGKSAPEDAIKDLRWVIKGDKIISRGGGTGPLELTFKLDPTQKPRAIDLTNPRRQETVQGIYRLDGKTLTLCLGVPGEKRPAEFKTREDLNVALFILERVK